MPPSRRLAADHRHVGLYEIAAMFGVTRQAVQKWLARTDDPLPPAVDQLRGQQVWHLDDVLEWARRTGRHIEKPN